MASSSSNTRLLAVGTIVLLVGVALVLVIVRGTRDDSSSAPAAQPVDTPTVEEEPVADPTAQAQALGAAVPEAIRIDSFDPLDVREGFEAIAVKVPYDRAVASLPNPGDVVRMYRQPRLEVMDAANPVVPPAAPGPGEPAPAPTVPAQRPAPTMVLDEVDVLAVIGDLPASNSSNLLTLVLEVPSEDVPQVIQLANDGEIWTTLLPRPEDTDSDS